MSETEPTQQQKLLQEMKEKVEKLWQSLIYAPDEDRKKPLREQYRQAMQSYRRQRLVVGEETSAPEEAPGAEVRPDPYHAHDYREFMLAWLRHFQQEEGGSLKAFSDKAGVSPQELARAIQRGKPMAAERFRRVLKAMGLKPSEAEFLETLHELSEAGTQEERLEAMTRLQAFPQYRKANPNEYEAWRYLTHWYYVVIREMSTLAGFRPDAEWVSKRLRVAVPLPEIRKALKFLEGSGFFRLGAGGRVEPLFKQVNCAGGVFRLALGQFHREMLALAADAIQRVPSEQRLLRGQTMAVPKQRYDEICGILERAMDEIAELSSGESSEDEIYHIEVAAYPLTRNP